MGQASAVELPVENVSGASSWLLHKGHVEAALTQDGGFLAPVTFKIGSKRVAPYSVAPWALENLSDPSYTTGLKVLRGDFFCAPFGANALPFRGEMHPSHGESANSRWTFTGARQSARELVADFHLKTSIRPGEIQKQIRLVGSHTCLYNRHTLSGFSGPMPLGHHATIKFPDEPMSGHISCAPFIHGQVFPDAFENPATKGYQSLKPGSIFKSLRQVEMIDGAMADLTHYPARPGFEDLVMMVTNPKQRLGWNAVTFPRDGYVWFALKDTQVLRNTVLWISNGGRHYAPWSGRHCHVMGIEDVTANFHYGLTESARDNPLSRAGMPTAIELSPEKPLVVNYIMGVVGIPGGFDRVAGIKPTDDRKAIILSSCSGHEVTAPVDLDWLF